MFVRLRVIDQTAAHVEAADFDGDGIGNRAEVLGGTDPLAAEDADADGLPDWWELAHFPGDLGRLWAGGDADGDGLRDGEEWMCGFAPDNPDENGNGTPDGADDGDGDGPGVWLELLDVKRMYVRARATPADGFDAPFNSGAEPPDPNVGYEIYGADGNLFQAPADEARKAVVFVHGWNMGWEACQNFGETLFKRLWHKGYEGRFAVFCWPTLTDLNSYNTSEHRAWKYGPALKSYMESLPAGYTRNIAAHSMGNVVAGAALKAGLAVGNYALMQAAVPAGCFDPGPAVNGYGRFLTAEANNPTPDLATPDMGYRGCLAGVSGNLVNFYNEEDFALVNGSLPLIGEVSWEKNQIDYKPDGWGNLYYDYDPACVFAERYQLWQAGAGPGGHVIRRYVTDHEESMSFVARPRSKAVGGLADTGGAISQNVNVGSGSSSNFNRERSDHSGQFNRNIQEVQPFYQQLMQQLGLAPAQ